MSSPDELATELAAENGLTEMHRQVHMLRGHELTVHARLIALSGLGNVCSCDVASVEAPRRTPGLALRRSRLRRRDNTTGQGDQGAHR
jgi:hypothetical protein